MINIECQRDYHKITISQAGYIIVIFIRIEIVISCTRQIIIQISKTHTKKETTIDTHATI
jgi:hypothetical protein